MTEVRDLIELLQKCEPTAKIRITFMTGGTHCGFPWTNEQYGIVLGVQQTAHGPVLYCKETQ
jgi:hypothetical protein